MKPVMQTVARMLRFADRSVRLKIHQTLSKVHSRRQCQETFRGWQIRTLVRAHDWRSSGQRRRLGVQGGILLLVKRVLDEAVRLVRGGLAFAGAALEQEALVLSARVALAWQQWRLVGAVRAVAAAKIVLHAVPDGARDVRRRRDRIERGGVGGRRVRLAQLMTWGRRGCSRRQPTAQVRFCARRTSRTTSTLTFRRTVGARYSARQTGAGVGVRGSCGGAPCRQ